MSEDNSVVHVRRGQVRPMSPAARERLTATIDDHVATEDFQRKLAVVRERVHNEIGLNGKV